MKTALVNIVMLFMFAGTACALSKNETAPLFSLRDINGTYFHLSSFVGEKARTPVKGIIVNFFATNCEPCKLELPILNRLVPEFEAKGVKVVIIGWNEDTEKIQEMLVGLKVDKPVILSDPYGKAGEKYGLRGLPLTVIITGSGKVHDIMYGALPNFENALKAKINKLK